MENYDKYEEYKDVASNSTGSADEKMEYYKDSVEAAQNRMTAALEDLVTGEGIENVLIKIYNLIADGIDNIGTIATLLGTIVVLTKGRQIAGALTTGAGKMIGGYMGALGGFQNVFTGGYWGGLGDNFKNSIEMAQMDAFDMSLQKITATLQATDVSIAKLGEDALISGQSIVRNIGKDSTMVLGGMDVANRQRVAKLAGTLNYTPEQIGTFGQYSRYANLGVSFNADGSIADMGNAANKLAKQKNITVEQAEQDIKNFSQALQQATQEVKENAQAQQEEANASKNAANSDNQESQNSNLASQSDIQEASASELAMSADLQEAAGGKLSASQTSVVGGIVGTKGYGNSAKGLGKAGSAASAGIGMIGSMLGTGMAMSASEDLGSTGTAIVSGITSLAPMIGSFFGPIGTAIGGAVSLVVGVGAKIFSEVHKTDEELLEEAKKASNELSELQSTIEKTVTNLSDLQGNETRFAELIKGVNSTTGQNVSLSDSEWSEYQQILSSIIDSRDDLYASYDEEGNIVAKNAQGIANLNEVMSKSIQIQKDKLKIESRNTANKTTDEGLYSVAGTIYQEVNTQYKKSFNDLSKKYTQDNQYGVNQFRFSGTISNDTEKLLKKYGIDTINGALISKQKPSQHSAYGVDQFITDVLNSKMTDTQKQSVFAEVLEEYLGIVGNMSDPASQSDIDTMIKHYNQLQAEPNQVDDAVRPILTKNLKTSLGYVLQGSDTFAQLSSEQQNFLSNILFGNIQANPFKNNDVSQGIKDTKGFSNQYEAYKGIAENVADWASKNNAKMSFLSNYDTNTASMEDESLYTQYLLDMFRDNKVDVGRAKAILMGMGYDTSNLTAKYNVGEIKSQRSKNTDKLLSDYGWNKDILSQLTGEELSKLFANKNFVGVTNNISELRNQLKELILGETANASEYFASLASELGLTTTNTKEFIEAIQNGNAEGSFGLSQLQEIADNLGITVETLVENISILGDINSFGQTEKSLSEIETQFEHIDAISQDLSDNGMISAENLETLINEFPELVQYVDDFDTLLSKLQDMGDLKTIKIQASIAGSIADSDKVFEEFISKQLGDNLDRKIDLGMFGNLSNLQTMTKNLYDIDEQGNATLKSFYQNMALRAGQTDSGTYADNSWAKFVAENRYDIDTSKGTVNEVNQKLYQAMKSSAVSSGLSEDGILDLKQGGLTQLLQLFQNQMTNNPQYLLALQGVATAEANLKAGKAAKQVENEEWEKNLSKAISDLKDDYDSGRIGIDNYIAGMEQLSKHSKITKEQLKELQESVEDAKFEKLSKQFEDGAISASKYRSELSALMKQNAFGSDDYNKYRDAFLSTFDSELDKLDGQKSLLYEKDYSGQRSLLNRENVVLTEKLAALEAAGLKNTKDYLDVLERIKTNKEEQLEINKQELEYQKEQLDNTMGAYNTLADYAIKQLEKERDLVEERYDEEIDKLQEVNDQKERSIELTKLQQELENAQKEKSRVYVGGIGFTYQANQAKIDEAEKNLEDYLADRKISDLGNAKERDLKYYEDQIDFWNEVKEMVEDVQTLASTEDAIRQLIKDGILPSGATIPSSLETLRQNVKLDSDGHVLTLGKKFDVIRTQYLDNAKRLWKVNAEWETNLKNIANVMSGFKNSEGMVEQFKSAFVAGVEALDITVEAPENTVDLTQLQNDLAKAKDHLNTIQSNLVNIGKVTVGNYVSKTKSDGVWGNGKYFNKVVTDTVYNGTDGNQYYQFTNSEKGTSYLVKTSDIQYDAESGNFVVKKGAAYYNMPTFSSGLEAGVMAHTGLAMLHGTPQKPEYVLNNDQAWTLLKNFATLSLPAFDRKSSNKTINYQFYGDLHLPNVQDPSTFFEELLRQSSSQFNITQSEY